VLDPTLDPLRRRKSAVELGLVRRAAEILAYTVREFRTSTANGDGVRTATLASERMAYAQGAQDVRMLASMRNSGMPQPLEATRDPRADPLLACIAVRHAGYWAEGLITIASKPNLALAAVEAALAKVLGEIRPGIAAAALVEIAKGALPLYKSHPFVSPSFGNGIGLSREEAPILMANELASLQDSDVLTLRIGATGGSDGAIASAMVIVNADKVDVIWK
jgi:Xaa-Pro aminopeptidase